MTDNVNVPREDWGEYKRSQIAHLRPYLLGETLSERVSISMADLEAGSPKDGDMIARNPANHDDQWLVAADYFTANFEPSRVEAAPKAECDTCEGRGVVGGFAGAESGYQDDACPSCQPESPKVEQESVAWIARNYDIQKMGVTQCKNEVERYEQNGWEIEPLYSHPAPASDELLDAAEKRRLRKELFARVDRLFEISDAKHKGPQS